MFRLTPRIIAGNPVARDVVVVLAIKLTLIILAGIFLFGSDQRVHVDADTVNNHLLGPASFAAEK